MTIEDFSLKDNSKPQNEVVPSSIVPNEYGGIYDKPKKPRISFLQSRLNKDNFWNLMFFIGTSLCIFIVQSLLNIIPGGAIILLLTLITAPYFIARVNNIEYKEGSRLA